MKVKLCKDCAYYQQGWCAKQPSLVTGEPDRGWRGVPRLQREDGFFQSILLNTCGLRGRWFEAVRK